MKTKKAVKYVEESLSDIYCDSCKDNGNLDICNYCHRKSMMWGISHEMAESIVDGIIKILARRTNQQNIIRYAGCSYDGSFYDKD